MKNSKARNGKRLKRQFACFPVNKWSLPEPSQRAEPRHRTAEPNQKSGTLDICAEVEYLVGLLQHRARLGDAVAAQQLAFLAAMSAATVTEIAKAKPELLRPMARKWHVWPVLKFAREVPSAREKEIFSAIQLGADSPIELDPATAKWKLDGAGELADSLRAHVETMRVNYYNCNYGEIGVRAGRLPPFDDKSANDWWAVAESAMLDTYPEPGKVPEFQALLPTSAKRRSPSRILEILRNRFMSLAPNRSYQT